MKAAGPRAEARYTGSCHCGAVRFAIRTDFAELTTCDCSICRRKNALMVKVHESAFELLGGEDNLTEYRFHTRTARHFFLQNLRNLSLPPQTGHTSFLWNQRVVPRKLHCGRYSRAGDCRRGNGLKPP